VKTDMLGRHRKRFLSRIDRSRLEHAIREAEGKTSAPIRVVVLPRVRGDLSKITERAARRLGMTALPERNGSLIVVIPARREFHVWGDRAIHEKEGDALWSSVSRTISSHFRSGDFTAGLVAGIDELGRALASHYPARPGIPGRSSAERVVEPT
jgi:uncharacterized membrane protein